MYRNRRLTVVLSLSEAVKYLSRRSHHHHHFLEVELVPRQVLNGHFIFNLAAGSACVVEELPEVWDPGLEQDELRREPLENHGHQPVWKRHRTKMSPFINENPKLRQSEVMFLISQTMHLSNSYKCWTKMWERLGNRETLPWMAVSKWSDKNKQNKSKWSKKQQ